MFKTNKNEIIKRPQARWFETVAQSTFYLLGVSSYSAFAAVLHVVRLCLELGANAWEDGVFVNNKYRKITTGKLTKMSPGVRVVTLNTFWSENNFF